ncbi:MAG TPA: carboxypeptidase-like regulatory domain-containing protein [Verrucomicrobiae bacterium]|nr:carboxypeptidase-like regulatory domain-containing protein [Verrucomicrobiae bacterium]
MKRAFVFAALMSLVGTTIWAAPFTQGNVVILRVGDGTEALTNAGNSLFLDEYTANGTFVQSIVAPTNQFISAGGATNFPIDLTGGNTGEGELALSSDGQYLTFVGYGTNRLWLLTQPGVGNLNISSTAGASLPRVVARVDWLGNFDTSTTPNNITTGSGADMRGVATPDGSNFWVASSAGGGESYIPLGANTAVPLQGTTNKRTVGIFNPVPGHAYPDGQQQVYNVSAGGVYASGTNFPTVLCTEFGLTNIVGSGGALVSPYGFLALHLQDGIHSNIDTVYIADDGSVTGGVSKWTYNPAVSNNWYETGSIAGNATLTSGTGGLRQLAGSVTVNGNQTNVTLYVVASGNTAANYAGNLYALTDSSGFGGTLSGTLPAPIASAPANTRWRGVALAPASTFRITSIAKSGNDVSLAWNAMGGNSYVVQASNGDAKGNYNSSTFTDLSGSLFTLGYGPQLASFLDANGATNRPSRYYRLRRVGIPIGLSVVQQPTDTAAGATISTIKVQVVDQSGAPIVGVTPITVAIGTNPSSGNLSGTLTVNPVAGVATFGDLSIDTAGTGYTLVFTAPGWNSATTVPFNITP